MCNIACNRHHIFADSFFKSITDISSQISKDSLKQKHNSQLALVCNY